MLLELGNSQQVQEPRRRPGWPNASQQGSDGIPKRALKAIDKGIRPPPQSHVIIWASLGTGHPPVSPGISEALPKLRTTTGEQAQDRALGPRKLRPSSFKNLGSELSLWLAPTQAWSEARSEGMSTVSINEDLLFPPHSLEGGKTVCVRYLLPGGQICPPQGTLLRKLCN